MSSSLRWLLVLPIALAAAPPAAGDWLVFLGGGLQETRGRWEVRGGLVRFHSPSGTFLSVRAEDVDLAASAFLTWQVGDRRKSPDSLPPAGAEMRPPHDRAETGSEGACRPVRVVSVLSAETLEVEAGGRRATVHLACLDAPETRHRFPELAWFGAEATAQVERLAPPGSSVCLFDENPPLGDRQRHPILYVELADGRDLGEEVIARGLGLVRSGTCVRRDRYLEVERRAIVAERGHWGPSGNDASIAIASHAQGFHTAPSPRTRSGGG